MRRKKAAQILLIILLASILIFAFSATLIVADGLNDNVQAADVAVVLGNKVEIDGRPSERLRARLDKVIELYGQSLFANVIVSGGIGSEGFDEAEVMKLYLVANGLPENHIFVDSGGATTRLTAKNAALIMRENGWQSALVVSQYFHISRSKLALRRYGISPVFSAHARYFEWRDVYSIAREVVGYGAYLLKADE